MNKVDTVRMGARMLVRAAAGVKPTTAGHKALPYLRWALLQLGRAGARPSPSLLAVRFLRFLRFLRFFGCS